MDQVLPLVVFIVSITFLIRSGSVIVVRLSRVAHFLQLSEYAASFALIAFATSLPDLFVGISAALHGRPELSFSNIIGANIITLTLAVGIAALLSGGLAIQRRIVRRDTIHASIGAALPVILLLDGALSRVDGTILLMFFCWYFFNLIFKQEKFTKVLKNGSVNKFNFNKFLKDLLILLVAVLVLVASAEGVTRSAFVIATQFDIAISLIGILLVAASITLPEIVFGARAVIMGHKSMVIGNIIGSVVVNSGLVIGLTALISPIHVADISPYLTGVLFTISIALLFFAFSYSNSKISRKEAGLLAFVYLLFVITTLIQN